MSFSRGILADRAGGFTQCNACGIAASITAGDERNGRRLEHVEAEHLDVCPGVSAKRVAKDKEKTGSDSSGSIPDIIDMNDLEKYIERQIDEKANELADFIIVENFHALRRSLADHFSSSTGKVLTWRFMGERGRTLLGRKRKALEREKEIYIAGATDTLAALAQELFWKIEDYKK